MRFAEEGAKVFAVDRDAASLRETVQKAAVKMHICDVTDGVSVKAMVQSCLDEWGRIDILVNNVGGSAPGGPVEMSEELWDAQVDHNLKSVFLACKHVLPVMERQAGGVIINLASTSALRWTGSAQVAYAATKAAVIQLSRVVAVQYASKGIRVNTVVPGQLHTPMVEARLAQQRAGEYDHWQRRPHCDNESAAAVRRVGVERAQHDCRPQRRGNRRFEEVMRGRAFAADCRGWQ